MNDQLNMGLTGLILLKHFEGCELVAYPDPGTGSSPWTIGYGNTFYPSGQRVQKGDTITQEQANDLLLTLLPRFEAFVRKKIFIGLLPHQFDALVDFVYNTGGRYINKNGKAQDYDLFRLVNAKTPGDQLRRYWENCAVTGGGQRLNGLVKRRKAEAELFISGNLVF